MAAAAAAGQMNTLSVNPVELFQLQQQQQVAQLQLQQQMDLQNFTAAMASHAAAAANNSLKAETVADHDGLDVATTATTMTTGLGEDDAADEELGDDDDAMEPHYVPNPYSFGELSAGDVSDQENALLAGDYSSNSNSSFLLGQQQHIFNALNAKSSTSTQTSSTKESFKKIKPVKRPGLVLKTPIAYQGNIDPSVIPIQRDGMGRDI